MRVYVSRGALCACGMLLLAGCAEPESTPTTKTDSPVASTRTRPSTPELDLANPLGASDDAAMLRHTADYSITTSALTSDSTMGVASGLGEDPLINKAPTLPGELPSSEEVEIDTKLGPPEIELPDESSLDRY